MNQEREFQVRVEGISFEAAHFATFHGEAERLHGHTYTVAAELEGTLADDAWVVDFGVVKKILRAIVDELDHRFLLQRESTLLAIDDTDSAWKVRTPAGIGYVLPKGDVVALPIDNSTSERLAELFVARFWQELEERGAKNVRSVTVEVWEGHGQRAAHTQTRK